MEKSQGNSRTGLGNLGTLVRLAVLIAILLVLEFTNIGYIKTPGLEFTIMQVPVIIGAIVMGPTAGAILGGVFGLTSFWQCFGKSAFGVVLMGVNPFSTFLVCVPTRILMGLCCGLLFRGLLRVDRTKGKMLSFGLSSLMGALLNTLFFVGALMLFFANSDFILGLRNGAAVLPFAVAFIGIQGLLEALICCVAGAAISRALYTSYN
ncbi:MAG: ECF transporter S component, partial [Oscillospiraceae bacterium]